MVVSTAEDGVALVLVVLAVAASVIVLPKLVRAVRRLFRRRGPEAG